MLNADTKERILTVAERLFGEEGFAGTSLRMVTALAEANLGAVNYHFRSKEALFQAVIERRLGPLATERLRRLEEVQGAGHELTLESLLDAYLTPLFAMLTREGDNGPAMVRLFMRVIGDPNPRIQQIVIALAHEMAAAYMQAFARVLPQLSPQELWWRFRMLNIIVAFQYATALDNTLIGAQWLPNAPQPNAGDPAWIMNFLVAAMRAPATQGFQG